MEEMRSRHAVLLDANGVYCGEVISDIASIEMNVPEGGSYELLPDGVTSEISAQMFPTNLGFIAQPIEGDGTAVVTDLFEGL